MIPGLPPDTAYEVYAVRFATNPARVRGQNFIGDASPQASCPMDFFCWVLVGDGQAIMVDTGAPRATMERHGYQFVRCPSEALAALGFAPDQVRTLVLTHLHFDHIGNLAQYPAAHVYTPRREMRYATGPDMAHPVLRRAYDPQGIAAVIGRLFQGQATLHPDAYELAPGLSLHALGGHTAGQGIVRVRTRRGWVVLASDTLHYYEELERGIPFAVVHSVGDMLAAHGTIRALADSDRHVIPAHDPLVMQRYAPVRPDLAGFLVRVDAEPRPG